ncbi:MAG: DUF5106 domain-containing protein [Candidatus Egerieousia sp.]|nr:DUF5106 domain-containing protein [Candidatus Egerieousia sp.]
MRVTLKSILLAMASLVVLIFLSACTGKRADAPKFPYPKAPLAISQPVQKAQYLVEHYWDKYIAAAESGQIEGSQIDSAEWAGVFKNYFALLSGLYSEGREELCNREIRRAVGSADSLYLKGSKSLLLKIVHYSELFLYDPNSPLLNEELYIPVVEELLASQSLEEESKLTLRYQLEQALVNSVGTKAADIKYKYCIGGDPWNLRDGSLYGIKADYTLIFFNNPDCPACAQMLKELSQAPIVQRMVEQGRLAVLALYIDQDLERWRANLKDYPQEWIYARDYSQSINIERIYTIRAIPSLYLLDSGKRVLLKDAPRTQVVLDWLFSRKVAE